MKTKFPYKLKGKSIIGFAEGPCEFESKTMAKAVLGFMLTAYLKGKDDEFRETLNKITCAMR